jgi:hypothetical protein
MDVVAMFGSPVPEDVLKRSALDLLPLSSEPLVVWTKEGDLFRFLEALCDYAGERIDPDGTRHDVNYRDYAHNLYDGGRESAVQAAARFQTAAAAATPVPGAVVQEITPPKFEEDETFGLAAKHAVVWDSVVNVVLCDGAFYSLAHILESGSELECSLLLAERLFYKQGIQVLRNFVEELVLPVHFCGNPAEFESWRRGEYRIPPLRDKRRGVLTRLTAAGLLTDPLADELADLYGVLNGAVHASASAMVHKGVHTGQYMGHVFKYDDFRLWADLLARSVRVGAELLRVSIQQWQQLQVPGKLVCDVCHRENWRSEEVEEFGGQSYQRMRCEQCGRQLTVQMQGDQEGDEP